MMAMTKKKVPKDTILKVSEKSNYESSTIKGKGNSKKTDIKIANKNLGIKDKKSKK